LYKTQLVGEIPVNPNHTLSVVRRYHEGWTTKNYEQAIDLLAPALEVEVPVNEYPTTQSFADALRGFGDLVENVGLIAEMSKDDQAMLLYDMQVDGIGLLRVAEHFTVAGGRITRLRQIHDTVAVRAAGLAQPAAEPDYARDIAFDAPAERVFDALTTLEGLAGWWTPTVGGNPTSSGEIRFAFAGLDEEIVMRVEEATRPSTVIWHCVKHTGHPEWAGTRIVFELEPGEGAPGMLRFRHIGLVPALSCYETCETGWDRFLTSLVDYAERDTGSPFR
jgi:uncharacterized protein YndB with AHSA1/START domain